MNCQRFQNTFQSESENSGPMRRHLEACPSCHQYVQNIEQLRGLLREYPRVTPPSGFETEVQARIAARGGLGWSVHFLGMGRRYAWAATVLISLTAGAVVWRSLNLTRNPILQYTALRRSEPAPAAVGGPISQSLDRPDFGNKLAPIEVELNPAPVHVPSPVHRAIHRLASTAYLPGSQEDGLTLSIRDESSKELRVIRVPPVVMGAQPILPSSARLISGDSEVVF